MTASVIAMNRSGEDPSRSHAALRMQAAYALVVAMGFALFDTLMSSALWLLPNDVEFGLEWLGYDLIVCPAFAVSLFLATLAAERATARGVHHALAWGIAIFIACSFATALQWFVLNNALDWTVFSEHRYRLLRDTDKSVWKMQEPLYILSTWSIMGSLATLLYAQWRRATHVRDRLHAAEVARADTERRVLEAELQATQARVEPQFLLDTLGRLKTLNESDPARAMAQLDSLIAYLRAALPRLNDTRSTLAQEFDLCRAYLDVEKIARGPQWWFVIEASEALATASMPAMVLLPLVVRAAGAHRPSVRPLTLRADFHKDRLRIALAANTALEAVVPADLRDRLRALYGDRATIVSESTADGWTRVVVEIPFGAPG